MYEITMSGMFATTGSYSYIRLQFQIPNPYGSGSETVDTNVLDSSNNLLGYGTIFLSYTASVMTGCSVTSSSSYTTDNATHTFKMTPSRKLISNSYLMINMPAWNSQTNSMGSTVLACAGVTV